MIKKDNDTTAIVNVEKNNLSVTQSNSLIEAHYSSNLTTLAHKVAKLIIGYINPNDPQDTLKITISITKLKYYLGWSQGTAWNRFYADLKDIAKRLNKEPIEIPFENGKILNAFFLSSYLLDIPKGEITFSVSPDLVPHLTALKGNFTSYQLKYIPRLTSTYAIRLYELFNQYKKIGHRQFEVEDFKKKVGAPATYTYNDLKKRVIVPSQVQLKENTNLAFKFEEIKTGRSVTSLQFLIFSNTPTKETNQTELNFLVESIGEVEEDTSAFSQTIVEQLEALGINEQNITAYLIQGFNIIVDEKKRGEAQKRCATLDDYYLEKLALVRQAKNKDNPTGFFVKALKEDWVGNQVINIPITKEKDTTAQRKEAAKQVKILERQIEKWLKDKNTITANIINTLIQDEAILRKAYDTAIEGMGPFFKTHLSQITHLPIVEQYKSNIFITQSINLEMIKSYPSKFSAIEQLDEQITAGKIQMEKLKHDWRL
jgi:plasmid replication initiation protein